MKIRFLYSFLKELGLTTQYHSNIRGMDRAK